VCWLRHEPIDVQVAASERRLAMVPEELRVKRSKTVEAVAPAGTSFCAGCQSFRDVEDFGKGATKCRACVSATTHAARVEKVYGIDAAEYARLLKLQDGKCAICRARPRSKRLAVDHDHTTGQVLGLLCSRCNHDLKGASWDSSNIALALWWYMHEPPTSGRWRAPETGLEPPERANTLRPAPVPDLVTSHGTGASSDQPGVPAHMQSRWQMVGSGKDAERGRYLVYIDRQDATATPPF
jgi:hypothetical protein